MAAEVCFIVQKSLNWKIPLPEEGMPVKQLRGGCVCVCCGDVVVVVMMQAVGLMGGAQGFEH